jgi:hypothetical protein
MLRYPRPFVAIFVFPSRLPPRGFPTATMPIVSRQGTQLCALRRGHFLPTLDHDFEIVSKSNETQARPSHQTIAIAGQPASTIANRSAVAKVILVPSDNETVAAAGCLAGATVPDGAPLMVGPSGLAGHFSDGPSDTGRENSAARSITGGPGHDVIVEPGTRPGPESMSSTSAAGRSDLASFALLIFRIMHFLGMPIWRYADGPPLLGDQQ